MHTNAHAHKQTQKEPDKNNSEPTNSCWGKNHPKRRDSVKSNRKRRGTREEKKMRTNEWAKRTNLYTYILSACGRCDICYC